MTQRKIYQIGDKTYWQGPLVLGQVEHLIPIIEGLTIEPGSVLQLMETLGPTLYQALACVLIEDGQTPAEVVALLDQGQRDQRAAWFRTALSAETAVEVIDDFFHCTPVTLLPKLVQMINRIMGEALTGATRLMPNPAMPSSAGATSVSAPASAEP